MDDKITIERETLERVLADYDFAAGNDGAALSWMRARNNILDLLRAALAAQPAPAAVPPGYALVPDYRGYANLGTGQYLLNISSADDPPELIISIASESEKAGRTVGDLQGNPPGTVIEPEQMAIRLGFATEAGLSALEQHLRILREERFAAAGDKP
jgi:hypothetical protein